jgi:hypothetical protein
MRYIIRVGLVSFQPHTHISQLGILVPQHALQLLELCCSAHVACQLALHAAHIMRQLRGNICALPLHVAYECIDE